MLRSLLPFLFLVPGYPLLVWYAQRAILFPVPSFRAADGEPEVTAGAERHWLSTSVGRVEAWYLPPRSQVGRRPVLIFAHGNGELIDDWPGFFVPLRERGVGVLLVEYPGYGRSEGEPSERSVIETMTAAYDMLVARPDIEPGAVIGHGRSLGGGAICGLARQRPLAALILQSTFTSVRELARRFFVPSFLVRDPFENQEVVQMFHGPVLVVHGRQDTIVPFDHGEALSESARVSELFELSSGHNDFPLEPGEFWRRTLDFLRRHRVPIV